MANAPRKQRVRQDSSLSSTHVNGQSAWIWLRPALLLIAITLIAYIPAMPNGFIWDDDDYVTNNPTLRSAEGLRRIWFDIGATPQYYPLVFTTFWLEYRLWGIEHATGYHVTNILLHALGSVLLWTVLRRLNVTGAWLAAAIFAVHPVHVESVAWITERKNVLSGVLYLSALLAYGRFAPLAGGAELSLPRRRWRWYVLAMALFIGALLSKTVTCSFPAAILLITWWKRGRLRWVEVWPTLPMFALGIAAGALTAWVEEHHVGGGHSKYPYTLLERCLIAGRVVWFYAGTLFWPVDLTFIYEHWTVDASAWWQYGFAAGAISVLIGLWRARKRLGRGPLAAVLFFGGTLVPALGFVAVYPFQFSFVADHFQYLASIGLISLAAVVLMAILRSSTPWARLIVPVLLLAILSSLTWRQAQIYKDRPTLWFDTLRKNPQAWIAHNNLAVHFNQTGDFEQARTHALAALQLREEYPEAHINLGQALNELGQIDEAIAHALRALEIQPRYAQAHMNVASALLRRNDVPGAEKHYREAVGANPNFAYAHHNLAAILLSQGRLDESLAESRVAVSLMPDDSDAQGLLGVILYSHGRRDEAIAHLRESLRLNPANQRARQALDSILAE